MSVTIREILITSTSTIPSMHPKGLSGALIVLIAVLCVALIRVLYIFTYPLNNAGVDTTNYYYMLINRTTSLTHASGYPFIVGSIARFMVGPGEISSPTYSFAILAIQHSIEVITLGVIALFVRRVFGIVTALFFLLLSGCSVFAMSWTSAVYPEWLQSCLLLITLFLVVGAISCNLLLPKFWLYVLAFLAFAWAYLTKYNAAIFLPFFLIPFAVEYRAIGTKVLWLLLAPLPALASVLFFVVNVHQPSTGTMALHHDAAWVFMAGLQTINPEKNVLLDDPGPNALQWLALSAVLPPVYERAHAWRTIEEPTAPGEEELKKKLRAEYRTISALSPAELKVFLNEHPLPEAFHLANSAVPFYVFIGLEESDQLGTKVFIEYVLRHPIIFLQSAIRKSLKFALTDLTSVHVMYGYAGPLVPGIADGLVKEPDNKLASGFALFSSTVPPQLARYQSSPAMLFWEPGIAFFQTLERWRPGRAVEFACSALSIIWAIAVTIRRRRLTLGPGIVFTLAIALLALVIASNMILRFRDKELRALWPLATLFWAVGIGSIATQVLLWFSATVGRRATKETERGG
jgi:hypothetical protein